MIVILSEGLTYGGAPLQVGESKSFSSSLEAAFVATGRAAYSAPSDHGLIRSIASVNSQVVAPLDTAENTLFSMVLPPRFLGPNDSIRITATCSTTNSVNSKTLRIKMGGVTMGSFATSNSTGAVVTWKISNQNSQTSQVNNSNQTAATGTVTFTNVDTTQSQVLSFTCQKASGGETVTLESMLVELCRAPSY